MGLEGGWPEGRCMQAPTLKGTQSIRGNRHTLISLSQEKSNVIEATQQRDLQMESREVIAENRALMEIIFHSDLKD